MVGLDLESAFLLGIPGRMMNGKLRVPRFGLIMSDSQPSQLLLSLHSRAGRLKVVIVVSRILARDFLTYPLCHSILENTRIVGAKVRYGKFPDGDQFGFRTEDEVPTL